MKNLPLSQIAKFLEVSLENEERISGFCMNSKEVLPGEVFFALKGEKTDGHKYLKEVKEKGAIAAIISEDYEGDSFGLELIAVEDVLESLHKLARISLEGEKTEIVAITGSVGKSTTKEFIATLLEEKFSVSKTKSNHNTHYTVPLMLLNRKGKEDILVLEFGLRKPKDIEILTSIAPPTVAVMTRIGLAHTAHFPKGEEEIIEEKGKIASHPKTKKFIYYQPLLKKFPDVIQRLQGEKISYSMEQREADYFISKHEGKFFVDEKGIRVFEFDLPFKETHFVENFLAALAVARAFKMDFDEINKRVSHLKFLEMRFETFEKEGITFIKDCYNANPESVRAALLNLPKPVDGGKKIAVLGAMLELGQFSEKAHLEMGEVAVKNVDYLLGFGKEALSFLPPFVEVKKPAEHFMTHEGLVKRLKEIVSPGDVVLLKGSRGMEMEALLNFWQ